MYSILCIFQSKLPFLFLKKGRGRPPKSFAEQTMDSLDLPPKAKRKSRPPRRHNPHYDPRDEAVSQTDEAGPSGAQTSSSSYYDYPGWCFNLSE